MIKKARLSILFFLVLFTITTGFSANVIWNAAGDGSSWHDPDNWLTDSLPVGVDNALINGPGHDVNVVDTNAVNIFTLRVANAADANLTIEDGASINVGNVIYMALNAGGDGKILIKGGSLMSNLIQVGYRAKGTIIQTGGFLVLGSSLNLGYTATATGTYEIYNGALNADFINCGKSGSGTLTVKGGDVTSSFLNIAPAPSTSGHVQLDGGTIHSQNLIMSANGSMDIAGGKLILKGDKTETVFEYLANGWITAYGNPRHLIVVDYDNVTDKTTVTAQINDFGNAWDPDPSSLGSIAGDDRSSAYFSWQAGDWATKHDVYFSDSYDGVLNADSTMAVGTASDFTKPYKGRQVSARYPGSGFLGQLELGKTYYWRIDEVGEANTPADIWTGPVWQFTVEDFLYVDNFDAYANSTELGNAWSGYDIYLTEVPDYTGDGKSMALQYYNSTAGEVCQTSYTPSISDWQALGMEALRLYFYGQLSNNPETMYVILEDTTNSVKVEYSDTSAVQNTSWQEWAIDLAEFTNPEVGTGIDLSDVQKITIGMGGAYTSSTLTGTVYFDEIGMYLPRCVGQIPSGDVNGDCVVNSTDMLLLSQGWLDTQLWP